MNRIWSEGLQIFKGERRSVCFLWVSCLRKSSVGFVIMQGTCLEACGWQPYNAIKWSSEMEFRRSNKNKITCKPISYGMKTNWCHYFIRILLDLYMFRAHRPIFRRVRTAVHTTIGSYSICTALFVCSVCCQSTWTERHRFCKNQWLCEQLYEFSWRWACGPETCRDPAIYE